MSKLELESKVNKLWNSLNTSNDAIIYLSDVIKTLINTPITSPNSAFAKYTSIKLIAITHKLKPLNTIDDDILSFIDNEIDYIKNTQSMDNLSEYEKGRFDTLQTIRSKIIEFNKN